MLIGISGYAQSGKDTVAGFLVGERAGEGWSFDRSLNVLHWADPLRECCSLLNPIIASHWVGVSPGETRSSPVRWNDARDTYGYEGAKNHPDYGPEFRAVMLRMGTEVGRAVLGRDVWVNALLSRMLPGQDYVVPDTRFPNEAEAIKERGGVIIRVTRTGVRPVADHPSETSLDDWEFDYRVENDGNLSQLKEKVSRLNLNHWRS